VIAIWTRILEVLGSNPDQDTVYSNSDLRCFPLSLVTSAEIITESDHDHFLPNPF
jgi:hypothetical protein